MSSKFKLFDSDSLKFVRKRVFFSITVFIFLFLISIYRISDIMLFANNISQEKLVSQNELRGNIYDRNGNILATSIESISLSINPQKIKNKEFLSSKLSKILDLESKIINNKLLANKKFVWLKRNITPIEYQNIINLGEINIRSHKEYKRIYPFRNVSSHIVGHVNIDQKGLSGIERFYDNDLSNSNDIILTIDINLQQLVRKNLINAINKYKAESGLAVILDIENSNNFIFY